MQDAQATWQNELQQRGFVVFGNEFTDAQAAELITSLTKALQASESRSASISSRQGNVYAARNIIDLMPSVKTLWQTDSLVSKLQAALGNQFGLVRGLYFDKHPDRPWSLPWHRDLTIAVKKNDLPSSEFRNPTRKAGVAHVEAPRWLLRSMLTLRIHLDEITSDNGPLQVIPGSHHEQEDSEKTQSKQAIHQVLTAAGDVLAMRPLLSHASGTPSKYAGHRRIIHLEFAASPELPDGFQWNCFLPPATELTSTSN